ncbi:MAG TPA: hypothetical protein VN830_03650 [Verrucomicrobiae bacterium]|nr:hypothetical protein [Verrucomicrobiae bacterium]
MSENFAGDLEYHPRRASIYFLLGAASACFWYLSPAPIKFAATPLVFILGSLTLVTKGIFLLRKSSEGWGLTESEWKALSDPANRKPLPSIPVQAAQILQDFGAGPLLLWPLLNLAGDLDKSWTDPPRLKVFAVGAVIFCLGWLIRKLAVR